MRLDEWPHAAESITDRGATTASILLDLKLPIKGQAGDSVVSCGGVHMRAGRWSPRLEPAGTVRHL